MYSHLIKFQITFFLLFFSFSQESFRKVKVIKKLYLLNKSGLSRVLCSLPSVNSVLLKRFLNEVLSIKEMYWNQNAKSS